MQEKQSSARTTVILAVCAVAIGFYVIVFGLQTLICLEAHRWAWSSLYLKEVPQTLPTTIASPAAERNLQFYGFGFDAPWKSVGKQKDGDQHSEVEFKRGPVVIIYNPAKEGDLVGRIRGGDPHEYSRYEGIFGANFFRDNYSLYSAIYGAAPNDVWPFTSRIKAIRVNTLLMWKLRIGLNGTQTIYNIQTSNMRGFQLGDPSRDRSVIEQLFDEQGMQLKLLITSVSGQPGTIPQSDINCLVDSLKSLYPAR
ncbi:MAG TPA: hypothetical protein VJN21_07710 [Candidatus Acidoferrales bacterium]|nr:hypothetical protein [Candidatus Acidoferrales bacterium]